MISSYAEEDIKEFYLFYNPDKINSVPTIIADANRKHLCGAAIFDALYKKYQVSPFPDRFDLLVNLKERFRNVPSEKILSAIRQSEFKLADAATARRIVEKMAADSASPIRTSQAAACQPTVGSPERELHQQLHDNEVPTTRREHILPQPPQSLVESGPTAWKEQQVRLTTAPCKMSIDAVMAEELRDWLVASVSEYFRTNDPSNASILSQLQESSNVCDALRNGVILSILRQRLTSVNSSGKVTDWADIKQPKTAGFFARENVSIFIRYLRDQHGFRDEVLFTDSDLCDAKNDRMVISCLLALAGKVYRASKGTASAVAPKLAVLEEEIETQARETSAEAVDQAITTAITKEIERLDEDDEEEETGAITDNKAMSSMLKPPTIETSPSPPRATPAYDGGMRSPPSTTTAAVLAWLQREERTLLALEERNRDIDIKAAELASRARLEVYIRSQLRLLAQRHSDVRTPPRLNSVPSMLPTVGACALPRREGAAVRTQYVQNSTHHPPRAWEGIVAYSPPRHYVAAKNDDIDKKVGMAANRVFGKNQRTQTRIQRLAHSGEYVVFHKITGKRTVVYVREVRNTLMIRVGGGWDSFEDWLERHVNIDCEGQMTPARTLELARQRGTPDDASRPLRRHGSLRM